MRRRMNLPNNLKTLDSLWKNNSNSIWLATTLSLHRNINKFIFPKHLETEKKKILSELISKAIYSSNILKKPTLLSYETMQALEKEYLYEHFLDFTPAKDSLRGESFLFDESGEILIKLNVEDHLDIRIVETKGNLEKSFEKIESLSQAIEQEISFAFSNQFGYLTEDTAKCGTGLVVQAFLHIPAIIETHDMESLIQNGQHEGVLISSILGSKEKMLGDMIVVKNRWTIGTTEESILSSVRTIALAITSYEKEKRNELQRAPKKNESLFDQLGRVVGTMKFCYTIDTSEALRALSMAKLGVEIGWLEGTTIEELNRQFFEVRRAHIALSLGIASTQEDINHERARCMRAFFTPITLHTD